MSLKEVSAQLPHLHNEYHTINVDAEILPATEADYRKAKKQEDHRQNQFSYRVEFLNPKPSGIK